VSVGEIVLRNETTGITFSKGCAMKNLCKIQGDATTQPKSITKLVRVFYEKNLARTKLRRNEMWRIRLVVVRAM
jgi:hypothetical protein